MDDMAPAATERLSDNAGRTSRDTFAARKKAAKKMPVAPVKNENPEPKAASQAEPDHLIDVLA